MAVVSMKQLLESGVHFGHQTKRWNPKMAPYIFNSRKDIHIIDLKRTALEIEKAYDALLEIVKDGGEVLFVGTKKQAQDAIKEEATRAGQHFVNKRWLGGTLTNFKTIRQRIKLLHDLYAEAETDLWDKLPKKEVAEKIKTRSKLNKFLEGIKNMKKLPEAIFVVDPNIEEIAVLEARKLGITVFGIVDTNCDPDLVDYIIPANDDAIRSIKLITWVMANACVEALGGEVEKYEDDEEVDGYDKNDVVDKDKTSRREKYPKKEAKPKVKPEVKEEAKPEVKEEAKPEVKEETKPEVKAEVKEETKTESTLTEEGLTKHTVAELRTLAKELNLSNYSSLKKADLIQLILESK